MLFVCAKEGKHVPWAKKYGVVEEINERENDENVILKKELEVVQLFDVNAKLTLKKIVKRESNEDYESEHKFWIVDDNEFLLKHAAKVYTRNVFNKFKNEMGKIFRYKVEEGGNANGFQSFEVKSKEYEVHKFVVKLDLQTCEGMCECQNFEFVGILCTRILKVFVGLDIDAIPDHFILPRRRQKTNKFRIIDAEELVHDDGKEESEALRLSHMCQESTELACLAGPSYEAYTIYIEAKNDLSKKLPSVFFSCAFNQHLS
ncbi:hypothetical protein Vadar_034060 [Vaccinium darrowii]|uniref:Uncharacterized protein n=1 Tax=Vaccinium darrowii TaxID=229202 RepID=A0ACB7X691_9ERIC|nr:hypothetical protein Vadar_034060 [Vaccinium darrowii]